MMRSQSGTSLIIVIILLVILMISALALVRSSETVGAIAGNVAFKQAATEAADTGIASANQWLVADSAVAGVYYATRQNVDAHGLPTVDWTGVPAATVSNFRVQYVVERLCQGPTPITNLLGQCLTTENTQDGSRKVGSPSYSGTTAVYYRVTVRVQGPRNAESYVQSLLSK
jgi:Tfp pilus assembly protein PilX